MTRERLTITADGLNALIAARGEKKRDPRQGDLFLNEAEALAPTPAKQPAQEDGPGIGVAGHKRRKGGRKPLDQALPREVVQYGLPADQLVCPHDGSELVKIGVEVSEQLDIISQQIRVIRHERVKYACRRCDHGLKVAPVPLRIIPKGLFTEAALAWIILSKFMDALPLYRIAALLRRFGGDISRGIGPPVRLYSHASGHHVEHGDRLWAGMREGAALMSDGGAVYDPIAKKNGLVHLGCWTHARRYFKEAEEVVPREAHGMHQPATQFLHLIGKLYAAEARARKAPHRCARLRRRYSRVVLGRIKVLLDQHLETTLPGGKLGQAPGYLGNQWPKLCRYVENGTWPICSNACENSIRPFVAGRRNWLFSDTVAGAKASLNLYSLIETCKANDVDACRYPVDLFRALPYAKTADDYEALLPWKPGKPVRKPTT